MLSKTLSILTFESGGGLGDCIMKLHYLQALRDAFPQAQLTWFSNRGCLYKTALSSLVSHGLLDEVVDEVFFKKSIKNIFVSPLAKIGALKKTYDIIFDLQQNVTKTLILKRIPHRIFISGSADFFFSDKKPAKGYKRPDSVLARELDLIKLASGCDVGSRYQLHLDDVYYQQARRILPDGPCYIGFAPGAGHPTRPKKWPLGRYIAVANEQKKMGRIPVFILGPSEKAYVNVIQKNCPSAIIPDTQTCKDAAGNTLSGILLVMALSGRLQVAVANDSGVGHLLAMGGVSLVSLFGPTNANKSAPVVQFGKVIRSQQWGSDDMDAIPIDAVNQAVDALCLGSAVES